MTAATSLHKAFVVVLFSVLATAITTPSLPENTNTDGNANNNNNNNNTNSTDIIHIYFSNKPSGTNSTSLLDVSLEYYRKYTNKTIKVHNFNTNAEALSSMLSAPADGRHLGAVGVPHILFYGSVDDRARPFTAEDLSLVYVNSYSPVVLVSAIYSSFDSLLKSAGALGPDDDEYMTLCSPIKYDAYYMLHKNIQKSYPALAAKLRYTVYSAEDGNYAWRTISTMCAALYCDVSTAINLGAAAHVLGVTSEQAVIDLPDTPIFKNIGIDDQRTTIYRGFAVSKNVPDEKKFELVDWLAKVSKDLKRINVARSCGFSPMFLGYPDTNVLIENERSYIESVLSPKSDGEENNKNTRVLITVIVCVVLVILIISAICVIKAAFIESEKEKFINSSVPLNNMSTDSQLTSALKLLKDISLSLDGKDRTNLERAMNYLVSGVEEVTVNTGFAYEDARFISKLFNRDVIYDETYVSSVDNSLNDISSYASAIRDLQSVGDGDGDGDGEEDSCKETDGFWKSDTEDNDTRLSTLRKSNKSGGGGGGGGNKAKHNTKKRRVKSQTRTAAIGTAKPATTISMTITPFSTVMAGITAGDPPPPTSPNDHQYSGDNDNETVWGIGKEKEIAAYGDKHLLKWGYSPKRLWKFSGEHSLEATFLYFFGRFDLFSDEFPYNTMARWISAIAGMYTAENPYHNARHAADALQAACYIIGRPEVGRHLDKDMRLALLVAVAVHDIMHLGRTNAFLCSIMSPVAIEYSDRSVEENNSVALAFALMKKRPELNIFAGISPGRYYYLRRLIIRLVLVTDMAKYHAPMTQLFKNRLTVGFNPSATNNSDNNNNSININSNIEDASSSSGGGGSSSSSRDGKNKHLSDNELLCVMIIKGADISNAMRKFSTSKMWGESLTKEFYLQGDAEKARGLPVSSFMDRSKPEDFPSSQCAFISYFCLEFFGLLCQYAGMNEEYELLKSNLSRWETMKKKPEATANMSSP